MYQNYLLTTLFSYIILLMIQLFYRDNLALNNPMPFLFSHNKVRAKVTNVSSD